MNGDRGQLILVTGLAVAVTLVALVLLLNTAIYTQNLATRGAQVEDGEAIEFRGEVVADVGGLLDAEGRAEHDDWEDAEANVSAAVRRYDRLLSHNYAERGTVAEIERGTLSITRGALLRQTNASRNFTAANGEPVDWTLAEGVGTVDAPGARNVRLTVAEENLTSGTEPTGFAVRLAGNDGDDWRAYVYRDADDGDDHSGITVAVKNGTESSASEVCSASGPEATVDFTRGTINGTACPALDWANGIDGPYDVIFENPDEIVGTYELTVDDSTSEVDVRTDNFGEPGGDASPRAVPAAYDAAFEIHFETPRVAFHTTVRTAPGEPR